MMRRMLWTAIWLVLLGGMMVSGNVAPTLEDQVVTTEESRSVVIEIRAEDEDIDPLVPASDFITFSIVDGPAHGVLVGDFEDVAYEAPHSAVVRLTYTPADGFVGTDVITLLVEDSLGEASTGIATIRIDVSPRRVVGLLSGSWDSQITFDVQTGEFSVFRSRLTEVYRVGRLAMTGIAEWKLDTIGGAKQFVFDTMRFIGELTLESLAMTSTLELDPEAGASPIDAFDYWLTSTRASILGLSLDHTLYLTRPQTASYQILRAQAAIGSVRITDTVRFDLDASCSFVFSRNDLHVSWPWCDIEMGASLAMTDAGWEAATFSASGIPVPALVWLPENVTVNAAVRYALDDKSLSVGIVWRPSESGCIDILGELVLGAGGMSADSVWLYGIRVECEVAGVTFVSATSLDPAKNVTASGLSDYFEVIRLSGELSDGCGLPGTWSVATYFAAGSTQLFDWGMTVFDAAIGISDAVTLSLELVARSGELGDPTAELACGWTIRW